MIVGGMADSASAIQAAGDLNWNEDMMKCQNHKLKKVFEVGEENSVEFLQDFKEACQLVSHVSQSGNTLRFLKAFQHFNDVSGLSLILHSMGVKKSCGGAVFEIEGVSHSAFG
jgi:hypothetical protein